MTKQWSIDNIDKNLKKFKIYLNELANGDESVEIFIKPLYIVYTVSSESFKLKRVYTPDYIDVLTLPSCITEIDSYAFKNALINKVIGNRVKRLNSMAFKDSICKEVVLPSVLEIKEEAFYDSALEDIKVKQDLRSIGNKAFGYCKNLKEFSCNSVKFMGEEVFLGSGLKKCFIQSIDSMCFNTFSVYKKSNIKFLDDMTFTHVYSGMNTHGFSTQFNDWMEKNFVDKNIRKKLITYVTNY